LKSFAPPASPRDPARVASREFEFLLQCIRANFDPEARKDRGERDIRSLDWQLVLALARENRVDVLLLHGLQLLGTQGVPEEVLAFLRRYEAENRARNQASVRELETILGYLAEREVCCLSFKGPLLGERAYGDMGKRFFWDLDLLARPQDLGTLEEVLKTRGYARDPLTARQQAFFLRYHFAFTYRRASAGPEIDVHWSLLPGNFSVPLDYRGLWDRSELVRLGDTPVRTFCVEDTLLYLGLHGAKEEWRRLQMIADVAAVIASSPDIDWARCLRIAKAHRGQRMFLLSLHLAAEWLGASVPAAIRERARLDPVVPRLATGIWRRLQPQSGHDSSIFHFSRWRMQALDRRTDGVRYWWRTVSMPRLVHLALLDLPFVPRFAYVPVRLVHDYVALPLWSLGRRAGRGAGRTLPPS